MKKLFIIFLFIFAAGISFGQTPIPDAPETPKTTEPEQETAPTPEPYTKEEFSEWMLDLRRAEIIFFGSLPFSFLISLEAVDVGRYLLHNQDELYRPWPFRNATPPPFTVEEQLWIVGSTVFISLTVAVIDFFINKAVQASQRKE